MRVWKILAAQAGWVVAGEIHREVEKEVVFRKARAKADALALPLVNYGCKRRFVERSDYNLDIVERNVPNFVLVSADTERLPFPDKSVVIFASHVIEHVENPDWLLGEFNRVSDYAYIITPSPLFPQAWLHPDHKRLYIGRYALAKPQLLAGPLLLGINLFLLSS